MLGVTEAVFKLTQADEGWDETVSWMLEAQRPFLLQTEFNCKTFAEDLSCVCGAFPQRCSANSEGVL